MEYRSAKRTILILAFCLTSSTWAKPSYVVMPYLAMWAGGINTANLPWADITHIAEAFALPNANGTLSMAAPGARPGLISTAHSNSTRVVISIGGASASNANWGSSSSGGTLNTFVANIMNMVGTGANSYDGVDIDWEFPAAGESGQFTNLMSALYDALHNPANANYKGLAYDGQDKQLTFYISPGYFTCGVNWGVVGNYCDYAVIPGYDICSNNFEGPIIGTTTLTDCGNVTAELSVTGNMGKITGAGFPKAKLVLGMPFYNCAGSTISAVTASGSHASLNTTSGESTWSSGAIVNDSQAFCFKMNWVFTQGLKGIAIWELSQAYPVNATTEVQAIWNSIGGTTGCLNLGTPTHTPTRTRTPTPAGSPTPSPTPNVIPVPGRIQAEDYSAYSDTTPGNAGGAYRNDDVDIEATTDAGGGYSVGWTVAGEWLSYTINVAAAGSYDFTFRVASANATAMSLAMQMDGAALGVSVTIPNTGSWTVWTNVLVSGLSLPAGIHTLRLNLTTGNYNINYIDVTPSSTPTPSRTATRSSTPTYSATPSSTQTNTVIVTLTFTPTLSPTPTLSSTATLTRSPTRTATSSFTATETFSRSPSPSYSATPTLTTTPSWSPSITLTGTRTATLPPTMSFTESPTPYLSATASFSSSVTPGFTASPTLTATGTSTPSCSPTPADSPTATLSRTDTHTFSPTISVTPQGSYTETPTLTVTPSFSPSLTPSPTLTASLSSSPTAWTASPSPTFSPTATQIQALIPTATQESGGGELKPDCHTAFLDPGKPGKLTVAVKMKGTADAFEFRIYSKALTCVFIRKVEIHLSRGWNHADLDLDADLPNGAYYSQIIAMRGSGDKAQGPAGKLFVLK